MENSGLWVVDEASAVFAALTSDSQMQSQGALSKGCVRNGRGISGAGALLAIPGSPQCHRAACCLLPASCRSLLGSQ